MVTVEQAVKNFNKTVGTGNELIVVPGHVGVFIFKKMPDSDDVKGLLALFHLSKKFDLFIFTDVGLQLLTISGDEFPKDVTVQPLSTLFGYGATLKSRLTLNEADFNKLRERVSGAELLVYCIQRGFQ